MRPSIRQVAEHAQVSPKTVSNVLLGRDSIVAPATRERVLEAVQTLGYVPVSAPVVQNRRSDTHIISVVFEHADITEHSLDLQTYQGLVHGARRYEYDLLTVLRHGRGWSTGSDELRYLDRRGDGFIFATPSRGDWDNILEILAKHQIPTVTCYRRDVPDTVAWVDLDNEGIMDTAVSHLVKHGHERIAYVSGPVENYDVAHRQKAWGNSMCKHGLAEYSHNIIEPVREGWALNEDILNDVFQLNVTAVVTFNDWLALRIWDSAIARGIRVPEDLSIVGVDNRPEAMQRGLTTIELSFVDIGRLAIEAWVELSKGGDAKGCCKIAPAKLVMGHTVCPPKTNN